MRYLPSGKIIVDNLFELRDIIYKRNIDLSLIDIKASNLNSLNNLFEKIEEINGSIDNWDVSNIEYLEDTFSYSTIQPDISNWNTSNIKYMSGAFCGSQFNRDISKWDVSNVLEANLIFSYSNFDGDISDWKFNKYVNCSDIIYNNQNFINKYNNGNEISDNSEEFLVWFEAKKEQMYEIHNNINKEKKIDIDDYLSSFELPGVGK